MALTVEMSDDIRKYETKTMGPFTTRQAICILIGVALAAGIGIPLKTSIDNKIIVMAVIVIPFFLSAYVKIDGMRFETLVCRVLYQKVLTPRKRKYRTPNAFRKSMERFERMENIRKMKDMTPKERKAFEKSLNKKKKITYSSKKKYKIYR